MASPRLRERLSCGKWLERGWGESGTNQGPGQEAKHMAMLTFRSRLELHLLTASVSLDWLSGNAPRRQFPTSSLSGEACLNAGDTSYSLVYIRATQSYSRDWPGSA
ncbi:unnamed protein product [Protopolystoma xenopodis]|uniref:Uncharacterized protein n=1 Tax=Protopolystoma xenopodis TaxID=117903 RepID=A0A3S5AX39_9PLAT|nr:unnamed protein product [Protopolystoma xenopodis]